jgi:hypothetical protein
MANGHWVRRINFLAKGFYLFYPNWRACVARRCEGFVSVSVSGRVGLVWFQDGAVQRATGNDAVYDERSDMAERTGEQCIA